MLSTMILSSLIIVTLVSGSCSNQYNSKYPWVSAGATVNCANEGSGSCQGPGRVYYGAELTWTYKNLKEGESVTCSNSGFGCDPLFAFKKKCYIAPYQSVSVYFGGLKILKTNDDGSNGDGVEEWNVVHDGTNPRITMNVDFNDPNGLWTGCNFDVTHLWYDANGEVECKPPANTENSNGFYDCVIYGNDNTSPPMAIVRPSIYQSGLKYTFNIKMGDYDANGVFDNGPTWDFTYTEPDHRSITDLKNNGPITRFFTREGPEGRKARIYLTYQLHESSIYPFGSDAEMVTCN